MKKILIVFSHGEYAKSKVNKALLTGIEGMPNVTIHNISRAYPDFQIDVPKEQALLLEHDIIVLQFPMYWYSAPALTKHWIDLVWARLFAYGGGNYKLAGKTLTMAISAGGSAENFTHQGFYGVPFEAFMHPFQVSAKFCKMRYEPPFKILSALDLTTEALASHVGRYCGWLQGLQAQAG